MQNESWANLYSLILALSGNDSFTTGEQAKLLANANRRMYQAYRASDNWPRYMGLGARPATDSVISREYTVAAATGSAETRSGTTVTIVCSAAVTFVAGMSVTVSGLSGTVDPNGTYTVASVGTTTLTNDTITYELTSGTGTETYSGTATVTPVAIPDIDSFFRVWDSNPLGTTVTGLEYEFWDDVDGAHVINNFSGKEGFWVAFKKEWAGPYLSSATDIPLEFFYWAAHSTYADYLRGDGQVDKALAEEGAAQAYLVLEIDRAENQRNSNVFKRRISTYNSRQAR